MKPHRSIETTSASPALERDDSLVAFRASAAPSWPHTEESDDSRPPLAELSVLVRKADASVRWEAAPGEPSDGEVDHGADLRPYLTTTGWLRAASHVKKPVVLWAAVVALGLWVLVMTFSSLRREPPRSAAALVGNSVAAPVVLRLAPEGTKSTPAPSADPSAVAALASAVHPSIAGSSPGAPEASATPSAPAVHPAEPPAATVASQPAPQAAPARLAKPAFDRW